MKNLTTLPSSNYYEKLTLSVSGDKSPSALAGIPLHTVNKTQKKKKKKSIRISSLWNINIKSNCK